MAKNVKAEVVLEWEESPHNYRLVAAGKWSPGYRDQYYIDRLEQDSLGEPSWRTVDTFSKSSDPRTSHLLAALDAALSRRAK